MRVYKFIFLLFFSCRLFSQTNVTSDYTYTFGEAVKNKLLGNYPLSIAFFNECVKVNPSSAASYYQLSLIYRNTKYKNATLNYAKQAVDIDNLNIWYLNNLINCYVESNKLDSALLYILKNEKTYVNNKEFALKKIVILFELHKYNKVLYEIKKFETKFSAIEETELIKFRCLLAKGKVSKAQNVVESLIVIYPNEIKYLGILAELYAETSNFTKSLSVYNKMFNLDSCNKETILSFYEFANAFKSDSLINIVLNNLFSCNSIDVNFKLQFISNILNKSSFISSSQSKICFTWLNANDSLFKNNLSYLALMTDKYLNDKDYEIAETYLKQLLVLKPDNVFFNEQYILLLSFLNRYNKVISQIDSVSKYIKLNPKLIILKGLSYYQLGNYNNCIALLQPFLSDSALNNDDKIRVYTYYAESLYRNGKLDSAFVYFDKALNIDSLNTYILNNYSYYLCQSNLNLNKAKQMSYRTLLIEPLSPTYLDTYAWILFKLKMYPLALAYIKKAYISGGENNSEIIEHYAKILYCNQKPIDANNMIQNNNIINKEILNNFKCE